MGLQHYLQIPNKISPGQAFAHCPKFHTADPKVLEFRPFSVLMWLIHLSNQLKIINLVSLYPTNYLILY